MAKLSLSISGMHCATCAVTIGKVLRKTPGVISAEANYATEKAQIEYNPAQTTLEKIFQVISSLGYQVNPADDAKTREIATLGQKFVVSALVALLALWGSVPGLMLTAPALLRDYLFLMLLTSITQFWVGWDFYRTTWSALKNRVANMDTLISLGTSVAYIYSAAVTLKLIPGEPYFDTAATIIALIILGKWLEARAPGKTWGAIKKLVQLQPKTARVIRDGREKKSLSTARYCLGKPVSTNP